MQKRFLLIISVAILLLAVACSSNSPLPGGLQIFFDANRTNIQPGESVGLDWHVEGEHFFGVDLNGQPVDPAGHMEVWPHETTCYTLGVDTGESVEIREVTVMVGGTGQPQPPQQTQPPSPGCPGPPVFTHFEANPPSIQSGQTTLLEWGPITNGGSGELVGSVILTPGNFGEVGSPGSRQVSPSSTTTYTLTATGCGGTDMKSVTVNVMIVGTPIPIPPPTPPGGGGWSGPAKVTSVVAHANPSSYTGPSGVTLNFDADITVDGACTVTYQWERSDASIPPVKTLVFNAAGTKNVTTSWTLGGGPGSGTVWQRVNILTPLPMSSNQATVNLTFTP